MIYKSNFHICTEEELWKEKFGEELDSNIRWKLVVSCFKSGICMCVDEKENLTIYETNYESTLGFKIAIVPCGRFDTQKTDCAPQKVIKEFLKAPLDVIWFIPSRKYNSDGYGEDMMSNQVIVNELTINTKTAYHDFYIREFSIESEESWDGLEVFDAIED